MFEGLEAGRLKKEWTKHPVFHFDMSTAKHLDEEQLESELSLKLDRYEEVYGKVETETQINQRFEGLVQRAVKQTGEKAVIIIDEYDAPLLDVMNDQQRLAPMRQIMRNFYSPIKSLDPYLRFVFITDIPYDLENKTEKHAQTIIYLIFSLLGYHTRAEVKSAAGRADAVCWTKDRTYVFEFKLDGSAEDALKQIDDKGYLIPFRFDPAEDRDAAPASCTAQNGRELVKVGVNIPSRTRTLESWKIETTER